MPRVLKPVPPLPAAVLLRLMWLASPALPVGGFSYSEGLEPAIDAGLVHDEASCGRWLASQQALALGRSELPLVAAAWQAWRRGDGMRITELNDWARTTRESSELRQQGEQMGRSLAEWLRQRHGDDDRTAQLQALKPAPTWPLGFALGGVLAGAPCRETLLAFGFGWCENAVQAALKAVPLGQSAGQRLLERLAAELPALAAAAHRLPDGERRSFAPMLALQSARHEQQYSRLFRS